MTTLFPWRSACALTLVLTLSRRERKTMRRIQMLALAGVSQMLLPPDLTRDEVAS